VDGRVFHASTRIHWLFLTVKGPGTSGTFHFLDQPLSPTAGFEGRGMTVGLKNRDRFPGCEALAGVDTLSGSKAIIIPCGFVRRPSSKRLRNRGEHGNSGRDDQYRLHDGLL